MDSAAATAEPVPIEPGVLPTWEQLPDDPATLKHMVLELLATLHQERRDKEALRQRLDQLLRRLYGPRTERLDPNQPPPGDTATATADAQAAPDTATEPAAGDNAPGPRRRGRPHGRRPLPENLPRRVVQHELTVAERLCSCGQVRVPIGVQTSEQLDWQPASLFVWEHRVHKYACPVCAARQAAASPSAAPGRSESGADKSMTQPDAAQGPADTSTTRPGAAPSGADNASTSPAGAETGGSDSPNDPLEAQSDAGNSSIGPVVPNGPQNTPPGPVVVAATKPASPIARGLPGAGLLANLIVSKYVDHLPLYRLERIYQRQGVLLPRSTTCDWLAACAELLQPLYKRMVSLVLQSRWLHTDDTTVTNQQPAAGATATARLWVYLGDTSHPYNVFDFTATRKRDGPQQFLANFRGYLHADAFSGYDALYLPPTEGEAVILEVACNAHARRKFYDARSSDAARSHQALAYYAQLYEIERQARDRDETQRLQMRQDLAVPILEQLRSWLDAQRAEVLPKSPLAEALGYALNNWSALTRYTEAGFLSIDNNVAEREMKRIAIGRKNWLFVGSERGGQTAAVLISFTSSCQRLQVEPWAYLQDVLSRLPTTPAEQLDSLLPDRWQSARANRAESPAPAASSAASSAPPPGPSC
jgi:transposase